MKGLIYHSAFLYHLMMQVIYGKDFVNRYKLVADNIDRNWSVLDLCCGDCYLKKFLDKSAHYEGRDFNDTFIRSARAHGIVVEHCDIKKGVNVKEKFDCVIMMGSMYHFIPDADKVLSRMKAVASKRVIISEPVKNIVTSKNKMVSFIARALTNTGGEEISEIKRLSLDEVKMLYERNGVSYSINAGKDYIGVFDL